MKLWNYSMILKKNTACNGQLWSQFLKAWMLADLYVDKDLYPKII